MKQILLLILFTGALLLLNRSMLTASGGESLFMDKCGKCHTEGGEAPVFAPVKYASSQWERFFKRSKHRRKKDISGSVSPEELEVIKKYLVDHAADSDRPVAAGLR